jgi:hypothetical protein
MIEYFQLSLEELKCKDQNSRRQQINISVTSPVIVADHPLWSTEPPYPQAFHVKNSPWIHNQPSIVALCNWSQLMTE